MGACRTCWPSPPTTGKPSPKRCSTSFREAHARLVRRVEESSASIPAAPASDLGATRSSALTRSTPTFFCMLCPGGALELPSSCAGATGFHSDPLFRKPVDGGATFTDPIAINQDGQGSDQYYPWIDVTADGVLSVGWNDRRDDPNNF